MNFSCINATSQTSLSASPRRADSAHCMSEDTGNETLHSLLGQVPDRHHVHTRSAGAPSINGRHPAPLELWQPDYCGDIDMAIAADGTWYHEGIPIRRAELWQLFSGILRREADGEYYLVTPVEKCRVTVALHPLIITDVERFTEEDRPTLTATLNAGGQFPICADYPLRLESRASGAAYLELPHGLSALCSRPAWYRLVDLADEDYGISSAGLRFFLA